MDSLPAPQEDVDVIVLGGSIAATSVALILSSSGLSVALVDKGVHPRFALGESLLKPTVLWMRLLAEKYAVPEFNVLANVEKISRNIAPTSGVKRCFGFVRHQAHQKHITDQWWSNLVVNYDDDIAEAHLFRQDTDAWFFWAAARRCQRVLTGASIDSLQVTADKVELQAGAHKLTAKYVVDCTGARSMLAEQFALREQPHRYRTASRSLFTHMINVAPFDQCGAVPQPAVNWHEGTLHHLLDDAWIWVIPFNNHRDSVNPLTSVGVTYYGDANCDNDLPAEAQWQSLLETYPALQAQFGGASTVRPWIKTGELQYSSRASTGERYCLLGAAYGGIDALFSRGLLNTMQSVYLVSEILIAAVRDNNFERARFEPIERLQRNLLDINDLLSYGFYCCGGDATLTSWWLSAWTLVEQQSNAHIDGVLEACGAESGHEWQAATDAFAGGAAIAHEELLLPALESAADCMTLFRTQQQSAERTRAGLTDISIRLSPLGFNFPQYRNFLQKVGFNPQSRILLQVEYGIAAVLEDLDAGMNLNGQLRCNALAMCLVKLVSAQAVVAVREQGDPASIQVALSGDELAVKLTEAIQKWVPNVAKKHIALSLAGSIERLTYREWLHTQAVDKLNPAGPGWDSLLCLNEEKRCINARIRLSEETFDLVVDSVLYGTGSGLAAGSNSPVRRCIDLTAKRHLLDDLMIGVPGKTEASAMNTLTMDSGIAAEV